MGSPHQRPPTGKARREKPEFLEELRSVQRTGRGLEHLFESLEPIVGRLARRYGGAIPREEIELDLHVRAYERYLPDYLLWIAEGRVGTFRGYVYGKHRNHVRAKVRKANRQRNLVERWKPKSTAARTTEQEGEASLTSGSPFCAPDGNLEAESLVKALRSEASFDEVDEHILVALENGHLQKEVATQLGLSEPTVSRRVAKIRCFVENFQRNNGCE